MDIGSGASLAQYNYQTPLQTSGLAGASAVGSLASAITTPAQGVNPSSDTQAAAISGAQYVGMDVNSATSLLASLGSSDRAAGLQAFDASVSGNVNLAISAYQAQQSYPATAPAAQASPSSTPTTTVDTANTSTAVTAPAALAPSDQNPSSPTYLQQAAQAATSPVILSLLA